MSRKFVDKLVIEILDKDVDRPQAWHKVLRTKYGGKPHKIKISKEDLIDLYSFNLIYAMHNDLAQNKVFKHYNVDTATETRDKKIADYESSEDFNEEIFGEDVVAPVSSEDKVRAQRDLLAAVEKEIRRAGIIAGTNIFKTLDTRMKQKRTVLQDVQKVKGVWIITHSRLSDTSLKHNLAAWGWKEIKKYLKDVNTEDAKNIASKMSSGRGKALFQERTQTLHHGKTTVGSGHIVTLVDRAMDKNIESSFSPAELEVLVETLSVSELFGPILSRWGKDVKEGKDSLEEMDHIEVTIGPSALNPKGDEAYDWEQLQPALARELFTAFKRSNKVEGFATREGSKPFTQRVGEKAAENIMDRIVLAVGPNAIKTQGFTRKKPKKTPLGKWNKSSSKRQKVKSATGIKRKKQKARGATTAVKRRTTGTNISLIALLNAKLPQTVMDNMTGGTTLQNRSGRFAGSVKALTMANKKGRPNIVYSYDNDPYQVFEMGGRGNSKWATPKRDPRFIIDKSIREIATGMITGKFSTTRM